MDLTPWSSDTVNSSFILDLTTQNITSSVSGTTSAVSSSASSASYSHLVPVFAVAGGLVVGKCILITSTSKLGFPEVTKEKEGGGRVSDHQIAKQLKASPNYDLNMS